MASEPSPLSRLVDLAASTLSPSQLRCFSYVALYGETEQSVADHYGCSQPAVHQQLFGRRTKPGQPLTGGAITRMREAVTKDLDLMTAFNLSSPLVDDKAFLDDLQALRGKQGKDVSNWFRAVQPSPPHIAAMGVLILLDALVDDDRRVEYTKVHQHIHPSVVAGAVPVLRQMGFVMSDGREIRVLKVPA